MPVFGSSAQPAGADTSTAGVTVPNGWGATWIAARAAAGTTRAEVTLFGDSTTFGQTLSTEYSWVQRVRQRSIAAGYADGGFGVVSRNDTAALTAPDSLLPLLSNSGFGQGDGDNVLGVSAYSSTVVGSIVTFQFKGTAYRLWYSKRDSGSTGGRFTYKTDGGAKSAVVDTSTTTLGFGLVYVTGLTEGTHTITVEHETGGTGAVQITPEFLRSTGITYHKQAISGVSSNTFFAPGSSNYRSSAAMGLDTASSSSGLWTKAPASRPSNRNVKLTGLSIGTNDLQSSSSASDGNDRADALVNSIGLFAESAKTAGADAFVCIPPFWATGTANTYMGVFKERVYSAAMAYQLAVVDLDVALGGYAAAQVAGYGGASGNPHLTQAGYTVIGDLVFDKIINR